MFGLGRHYLPDDFFSGACDIHCHLLPGVDDGFPTMEKSLQALKKLEEHGIRKMVFTPHFMKDYPDNERVGITKKFEAYKAEAAKVCGIELHLAAEYMLDACFMDHFKQGFLTLDKAGTLVLCETSYMMMEPGMKEMLYDVMLKGFQPVIAHPERYQYASKSLYHRWKQKDYLFQLNLFSLAGAYGEQAKTKAHALLKEGAYDYVGSDLHRLDNLSEKIRAIRLSTKETDALLKLIENNKNL